MRKLIVWTICVPIGLMLWAVVIGLVLAATGAIR